MIGEASQFAVAACWGVFLFILLSGEYARENLRGVSEADRATGLSSYLGKPNGGRQVPNSIPVLHLDGLDAIPALGKVFGHLNVLVGVSFVAVIVIHLYLFKTPWGLHLRSVGDSPSTSDAAGIRVFRFNMPT